MPDLTLIGYIVCVFLKWPLKMIKWFMLFLTLFFASCGDTEKVVFPIIASADRIEIEGIYLSEVIEITDKKTITKILIFANKYANNWKTPLFGTPIAKVRINIFMDKEYLGNIGISHNFITKAYGGSYSQSVDKSILIDFSKEIHSAIYEGIFDIIPEHVDLKKMLRNDKQRFSSLAEGSTFDDVYSFIKENNFEITYESTSRINVSMRKLNSGAFVDTVIAGQYAFNEEKKLHKIRFFGVELRSKNPSVSTKNPRDTMLN